MSLFGKYKELILIVMLSVVINLFFINKPFHMDDTAYISAAEKMRLSPFSAYHGTMLYRTNTQEPAFDTILHPPLVIFYIKLVLLFIQKNKEIILHLAFLVFPIISLISMYYLGKRFTQSPLFSALLLLANPAFMVLSHSVMLDIPLLAFSLAAIVFFIYGIDKKKGNSLFLSGACIIAASMTKYLGLALIPLLFSYWLLKYQSARNDKKPVLVLLITLGFFLFWNHLNIVYFGKSHFINSMKLVYQSVSRSTGNCLVYLLASSGGTLIFPFSLAYLFLSKKTDITYKSAVIFIVLLFSSFLAFSANYRGIHFIFLVFFLTLGILLFEAVANIAWDCMQAFLMKKKDNFTEDNVFLSLWFFGICIYNVFCVPFGAVRYMLLLLPPCILFFINMLNAQNHAPRAKAVLCFTVCFGTLLAILVAISDYQWACIYRKFPLYLKKNFPEKKVWFPNHWGFQYYMEKTGYRCLPLGENIPQENLLVVSQKTAYELDPAIFKKIQTLETKPIYHGFPMKVMHSGAGFYIANCGLLPYTISNDRLLDTFTIYTNDEKKPVLPTAKGSDLLGKFPAEPGACR